MNKIERMRTVRDEFRLRESRNDTFQTQRWATVEEAELLYNLTIENHIRRVVEIGTANGWTAAWFSLAGAEVYTFDASDRPKMYLDGGFPFPEVAKYIHFAKNPSPGALSTLPPHVSPTLWFIDANHEYAPARADCDAVLKLAKSGDVVVQHDATGEPGSARVWMETVEAQLGPAELYTTRNGIGVVKLR